MVPDSQTAPQLNMLQNKSRISVPIQPTSLKGVLGTIADILTILQPPLGGLVYLSILAGYPPLWLSWTIFLIPFALRYLRQGVFAKRTPFDIPIALLFIGLVVGFLVSDNKTVSSEGLQTYIACILVYYSGVANGLRWNWYWKSGFVLTLSLIHI